MGSEALAGLSLVFPLIMLMQQMANSSMGGAIASASKADIGACPRDVRFTPKSGHCIAPQRMSAMCQKQTFCDAARNVVIRSPRRRGRARIGALARKNK